MYGRYDRLKKLFPLFCILSLSLSLARPIARAENAPLPKLSSADPIAEDLFRRSGSTGMVIVVVRGDERWMQSYGQTHPGSHRKPDADSLIRLCSLSKIMTTDLLVKLVAEKRVSLSDSLQKFAPHNVSVPMQTVHGLSSRPVTLGDLATHTAGLPREIAYPPGQAGHFTFPDFDFRWQWLPGFRLRTLPGTAAHYSNIGFDLLADALAVAAHEPYAQLFAERIAKPLGLRDTTFTPTDAQCARLLGGARNEGPCSATIAAAGSGGVYSTASDMTRWLEYLLHLPGVPVYQDPAATATYIQASQLRWTQGLGHAGVPTGIGLGWVHINNPDEPTMIIQKTGGGAGFTTYIALNPAKRIGLFVAATEGRHPAVDIFHESNDLLTYLAGLPSLPGDSLELAKAESQTDVSVHETPREVTPHRHHRSSGRSHAPRSMVRNTVTAGQ